MVSTWLMNSTSQPIGVTVLRHHSTGNARYGYIGQNNDPSNAPGSILIQDSFSDQSGSYGAAGYFYEANGAALIFQNLTVTNPHVPWSFRLRRQCRSCCCAWRRWRDSAWQCSFS